MTRSRDSLVAKEQEQLRAIAESKAKSALANTSTGGANADEDNGHQDSTNEPFFKQFKARPLPATTGSKGMGGLEGVPKVAKKPTTTPFSPLLGSRRPQKMKNKAREQAEMPQQVRKTKAPTVKKESFQESNRDDHARTFKARPVPPFVGLKGQGGQSGVPKVPKRRVTVPHSPCLGPRRRSHSLDRADALDSIKTKSCLRQAEMTGRRDGKKLEGPAARSSGGSSSSYVSRTKSPLVSESPILLGLKLLDATPDQKNGHVSNDENMTPRNAQIKPYEPYSTIRAKKRASFDARRDENLQRKMEQDRKNRDLQIRKMHKDLQTMRKDLL
jgi:hypothetical protein